MKLPCCDSLVIIGFYGANIVDVSYCVSLDEKIKGLWWKLGPEWQATVLKACHCNSHSVLDGNRTPILRCPGRTTVTELTKQLSSVQYRNTGTGEPNIQSGCRREAKYLSSCWESNYSHSVTILTELSRFRRGKGL